LEVAGWGAVELAMGAEAMGTVAWAEVGKEAGATAEGWTVA
jgi:hypothetical protein